MSTPNDGGPGMKIATIMWSPYMPLMKSAADESGCELTTWTVRQLNTDPARVEAACESMRDADVALLYRTGDAFWEDIDAALPALPPSVKVIVTGADPSYWTRSSVEPGIAGEAYRYLLYNGKENFTNLIRFLLDRFSGERTAYGKPAPVPWQGIFHPSLEKVFFSTDEYLREYRRRFEEDPRALVGVLFPRTNWITGNLDVEKNLIAALERRGLGVIPAFCYSLKDGNIGNMGGAEVVEEFFCRGGRPLVGGIVRLSSFYLGKSRGSAGASESSAGAELMKRLNIPIFNPVISYYKNHEEWLDDSRGLGSQIAWSVAMPEFEGVIEPVIAGVTANAESPADEHYEALPGRIGKIARRVERWIDLARTPNSEKKIVIMLHNNPCGSVEGTVGSATHLDALDSAADILKRLESEGYRVVAPSGGKELIDAIMDRKAVSEFRWTTVDEIVAKGGVLAMIDESQYREWFDELPGRTRARMIDAWGNPPGEEKDGMPAGMVYGGKMLVTGVRFGNAIVCVQPKRGCVGARCDGQVCKILHDPDVPPPHQYLASYWWFSRVFGAHAIIHVGTHGNMEFLPGKAVGLSDGCMPDIAIDAMPNLYIYNADNPPEGTIAKRRGLATLVDHMQTVMVEGELYGVMQELEQLIDQYDRYASSEPGKAHTISHMIKARAGEINILDGVDIGHENGPLLVRTLHERLSLMKSTRLPMGMHRFGRIPDGEKLAGFIYGIVRYSDGPGSIRGLVARHSGKNIHDDGGAFDEVETAARALCFDYVLKGTSVANGVAAMFGGERLDERAAEGVQAEIDNVRAGVLASDEMGSLMNGLSGGFIAPGPSGIVTRGRADILPTGRNFYSLDPDRVPTPAAWEIGKQLADKTIDRFLSDEGRFPENIAFYWMCNDIMWADGEGLAQMMWLLGVRPVWKANGRCEGFDIIPVTDLARPRIDVTVRVSGITRDNFPSRIELLDDAIMAVASLDEPGGINFVRRHVLERLAETGGSAASKEDMRAASYRVFASMPGTYQAGTQLAVFASAWKTEEDLADVFLHWNGYAYGRGAFGKPEHESLRGNLKTVDATFNKAVTDEYDLSGCCAYFGAHGGMINAARNESGRDVRNYFGDTRESGVVTVRTLSEEIRRVARAKILNPKWIEAQKEHGYRGASEISKRIGRIYGWEATTGEVDDSIFDDFARTFVMNGENRRFFEENNPWALEEIGRRLLEAHGRGLWNADPEALDGLRSAYLQVEGWLEEDRGDATGDFQGGKIDVISAGEVVSWKDRMNRAIGKTKV